MTLRLWKRRMQLTIQLSMVGGRKKAGWQQKVSTRIHGHFVPRQSRRRIPPSLAFLCGLCDV